MNIWFNHWFSTAYTIIELMREGHEDAHFICTSKNPDSILQKVCEEFYPEPADITDEEYIVFALDFCREHKVDVFVPRRAMAMVSKEAERFKDLGVKLLLDTDYHIFSLLADKAAAYKFFAEFVPEAVPVHYTAYTREEFVCAYEKITADHARACVKFSADEGAASFRVIDNTVNSFYRTPGLKVPFDTACDMVYALEGKRQLLVMPYLEGTEISVDCLSAAPENIMIPRHKSGRSYTIEYDPVIMELAGKILDRTGLSMPCNIQFKCHDNKPYILEINTRMSGGTGYSCAGAGVNIPSLALDKVLGKEIHPILNFDKHRVSYIETPLILS